MRTMKLTEHLHDREINEIILRKVQTISTDFQFIQGWRPQKKLPANPRARLLRIRLRAHTLNQCSHKAKGRFRFTSFASTWELKRKNFITFLDPLMDWKIKSGRDLLIKRSAD